MATTIQNFFSKAADKQFSRDFLFRVKQISIEGVELNGEDDLIYARSAALPGRTVDDKVVGYFGQEFHVPGRATYPNSAGYSIEFYHDEKVDIRRKLEKASRAVWDNETSTGQYGMPGDDSIINLSVIDKELNEVQEIKLIGASIRDVGEISYSIADGSGEVLNFPVTFAYHWYENFSS